MTAFVAFSAPALAAALLAGTPAVQDESPDRLYGRIATVDGTVYEGFIRWDNNEGSWADILNGSKELPYENFEEAERLAGERPRNERSEGGSFRFLGIRVSWDDEDDSWDDYPESATSGLRFGHIRAIEPAGRDRARIVLRSGETIELEGGSGDIGDDSRGIVVEDPVRGSVELRWRDIERVELSEAPAVDSPGIGERLYGTLRTRRGGEFTGYVAWDVDEIFASDVLDGEEQGRDREVPFGSIRSIERYSSSGARVRLVTGDEIVLRDTNDVDDSNRGISVSDPALGQVTVDWDEFESMVFEPLPKDPIYDAFDGGHRLRGTVRTEDGRSLTGYIRWDNDEEWSWELLDGNSRGVEMDMEFSQIASIEKRSDWGSLVTLRDGRTFELEDSNDVDDGNKGVLVTSEGGETVLVTWDEFRDAVLARR